MAATVLGGYLTKGTCVRARTEPHGAPEKAFMPWLVQPEGVAGQTDVVEPAGERGFGTRAVLWEWAGA